MSLLRSRTASSDLRLNSRQTEDLWLDASLWSCNYIASDFSQRLVTCTQGALFITYSIMFLFQHKWEFTWRHRPAKRKGALYESANNYKAYKWIVTKMRCPQPSTTCAFFLSICAEFGRISIEAHPEDKSIFGGGRWCNSSVSVEDRTFSVEGIDPLARTSRRTYRDKMLEKIWAKRG